MPVDILSVVPARSYKGLIPGSTNYPGATRYPGGGLELHANSSTPFVQSLNLFRQQSMYHGLYPGPTNYPGATRYPGGGATLDGEAA